MAPYEKESSHSSSDFETSLSEDVPQDEIPPAVIEAEDDKTTSSGMSTMVNMQNPADVVGADQTLHVAPLSMVPMRHQEALTPLRGQEAPIPAWLKGHDFYVDGDWKAFYTTRSNGHKDWTNTHREYCTKFRSKPEVELFLNSKGTTNGLFKGRKLRRKKTAGLDGHGSGTSKPTRGRKAANNTRGNKVLISNPNRPMRQQLPPGFL